MQKRKVLFCAILFLGICFVMYLMNVYKVAATLHVLQTADSRFPTYLIIGFGKAGTKALYEVLKLHSSLSGPQRELRYYSLHYLKGLNWYLSSLPSPPRGVSVIEKSPDYVINPDAPRRIIETATAIGVDPYSLRFIVITRNPIDRALSEYVEWSLLRHQGGHVLPPFHNLVIGDDDEVRSDIPILNSSCYSYHIKKWLQVFKKNQFCYVDGDRFIVSPFDELHKLELCLGLPQFFSPGHLIYNLKTHFFCFQTTKIVCMNKSKGRSHPKVPTEVERKLMLYFEPWKKELEMIVAGHGEDRNRSGFSLI